VTHSFRTRLAALMILLVLLSTAGLSAVLGESMSARALREHGLELQNLARSVGAVLGEGMDTRYHEIQRLAEGDLFPFATRLSEVSDLTIDRVAAQWQHYSWVGVARPDGEVTAASRHLLVGASVAERTWFKEGLKGGYTGDVHKAKLLAGLLPPGKDGDPARFIDFSAPLIDATGRVVGVLGAHVNWDWAREVISVLRSPSARQEGMRVFIVGAQGEVLLRPLDTPGSPTLPVAVLRSGPAQALRWDDGSDYLTASLPVITTEGATRLGWHVVVRQPISHALAGAHAVRDTVWKFGLLFAVLVAAGAWLMASSVSRPLAQIHLAAERIARGESAVELSGIRGASEIRSLGAALHTMMDALAGRERALRELNETLELKVAERTQALEEANTRLELLAMNDPLTGLPNRRAADARLLAEVARHRRSGRSLAALVVDIDHFKSVNDTHGHAAGDVVLQVVAQRLQSALRNTDFVARTGGEEFWVLLPETDHEGALTAAEKLRNMVCGSPLPGVGTVSISLGIRLGAQEAGRVEDALHEADLALYAAKAAGRNRAMVYTSALRAESELMQAT
jgi:diguanylate cyclase (GGDEF)-like protein